MLRRILWLMVLLVGVVYTMQEVSYETLKEAVRSQNAEDAFKYMLKVDLMKFELMQDLIKLKDSVKMTALHWAVIANRADVAALLVAKGADFGAQDVEGQTPLDLAKLNENNAIIKLLEAQQGMRDLASTVARQDADGAFKRLLMVDLADFKQIDSLAKLKNSTGRIPLHFVAAFGLYDVARLLLDHSNKEERDNYGCTPLHVAIERGQYLVARMLIEHGADKNAQDNTGATPLHKAAALGKIDIAQLLLESGADKEFCDFTGNNPLHTAVFNGQTAIVELLLDNGVDKDAKANFGYSPLHIATERGWIDITELLLKRGANKKTVDDAGRTPYDVASAQGNIKITNLLQKVAVVEEGYVGTFMLPVNYHGLIIVIGDKSPVAENIDHPADALCCNLAIAIVQQAAPIIVAAPILRDFLWRRNEIMENFSEQKRLLFDCIEQSEKSNAAEVVGLYGDNDKLLAHEQAYLFSQIPFDRDWEVFSSSDQTFYLLVPKKVDRGIKNELNLGSPVDIQTLVTFPKHNIESSINT